uniref:Alpha-mannosidase n=1 Tax=uncultured Bacillota bacterium TaxID=344338 RepID=A0A650EMH4_9FIRM|nr:alpha-mannosidase [uncultured Firmicutes bacterium]
MDKFIKDKIKITCENLAELSCKNICEIDDLKYISSGYKTVGEVKTPDETWLPFGREGLVNGRDKHFWFYTKIKTPDVSKNQQLELEVITGHDGEWDVINPQGILYLNGEIVQGIDINHRFSPLQPNTEYEILLYFYTGDMEKHTELMMNVRRVFVPVRQLYYDIKVPFDAALCYPEDAYEHIITLKYLEQACNRIDFRNPYSDEFFESIAQAAKYIKYEYYEKVCGNSNSVVSYIGHTHIDVAWLWTLAQTREKVQRTFSTVLSLMEQYPEYIFMSSQPQLYEYLKQEEPALYEKVKEKVKEGRWEVEGAMWLEADCNLSSGESLIRQILYGKRFIKDEFDIDSHILWLPDVFGYSAALPQILAKTGVDKFVTSKISWNETNQLPVDSFLWEGIDGTEIFTYFLTAQNYQRNLSETFTTYNGTISPEMNLGTWTRYQQKEYNNETIVTFGHGDGGGGPTAEMLENEKRLAYGLPGMPKAQMSFAGDFLNRVEKSFRENCKLTGRIPKWVGELYLELHRGTYTSAAKTKKNNRECEFLCQTAETLSAVNKLLSDRAYPAAVLERSWKTILLNQFHDIIPGSSIFEVYEESDRQYQQVREEVGGLVSECIEEIASNTQGKGLFVYNPNSFEASGYVKNGEHLVYAENIPPLGWKVIKDSKEQEKVYADKSKIESRYYSIAFDENMNISSLYDKENGRDISADEKPLNVFRAFEDYPRCYDNWEITNYYKQKMWQIDDVKEVRVLNGDGFGGVEIIRGYMNSEIRQKIIVYAQSRRIDFETEVDWHEKHTLLKVAFPFDIHANKATYEIQFGHVERPNHFNTSWEQAKFEVCAHKWVDVSEEGYGVSLLNNCKYGYSMSDNEMSLTLIKCGTYPNENSDQGQHCFTYSLYPHKDGFKQGGTIQEAYLLNRPLMSIEAKGGGMLGDKFSFVSSDSENIIIETVKESENGKGIVIRLYDAWNKKSKPELRLGFDAKKIYLCDMLENKLEEIGSGNRVKLSVRNFEIITLLAEV